MMEYRRGNRVKTEGDKLTAQLQREKSIFKNLSWQIKQKDRKISFLQKYHLELQQMIKREQESDSALLQRLHRHLKARKNHYSYHSNMLKLSDDASFRKRMISQSSKGGLNPMGSQSTLLGNYHQREGSNKK